MKKKLFSMLSILLVAMFVASPASAGKVIKLSRVTFRLGSLISEGFVKGTGETDITIVLDAKGVPVITCTHPESADLPGRKHLKVFASGQQTLSGDDSETENGKRAFSVETVDPETLPWDVAGCPSSEWTARIDFISWTKAAISVYDTNNTDTETLRTDTDTETNTLLLKKDYNCKTKQEQATVSCKPVRADDDDDDRK